MLESLRKAREKAKELQHRASYGADLRDHSTYRELCELRSLLDDALTLRNFTNHDQENLRGGYDLARVKRARQEAEDIKPLVVRRLQNNVVAEFSRASVRDDRLIVVTFTYLDISIAYAITDYVGDYHLSLACSFESMLHELSRYLREGSR